MNKKTLRKDVHQLLRKWHKPNLPNLDVLTTSALVTQIKANYSAFISDEEKLALATKQVITNALDTLKTQEKDLALVLSRRFLDVMTIIQVSHEMNVSQFTISRWQRDGITRLTEIIDEQERELLQTNIDKLEAKLPPQTYQKLVGRDRLLQELVEQLIGGSTRIACITGYGGVGKSSLANNLARLLIHQGLFTDVVWFSYEDIRHTLENKDNIFHSVISHLLTKIDPNKDIHLPFADKLQFVRRALRQNPYLLILDNFNDKENLTYLVDRLHDLVGQSCFILTSRSRPVGGTATIKELKGLNKEEAQELFSLLLMQRGQDPNEFDEEDMTQIYEKLGGNPLAITIFVSLLDILSASYVLDSMSVISSTSDRVLTVIAQMWQIISNDARLLLQCMGIVSEEGATYEYMNFLFAHSDDAQRPLEDSERRLLVALGELLNYSLIIILGTKEKRYKLHPLTRTFVNRKISRIETDEEE